MAEETKKKFKYDMVADQILEEIKRGRWSVGDKLPSESELVSEFAVSRVCLREGLKKLNVLGILKIVQGDGTYVNEINFTEFMKPLLSLMSVTENDIDEIYMVRTLVQGRACKMAAQYKTPEDVEYLDKMVEQMEDAIAMNSYTDYALVDRKFHNKIVHMSKNRILIMIDETFREIVDGYVARINSDVTSIKKFMLDHQQIIYAIKDGNEDFAEQIMQAHMEYSRKILHQTLM
ncbi:MAG: FadR family transcriptional regulator [Lachnospiraceae bacterium]|jgi:GntR family transcriptional repressor for pyruvate dehydrogenase complex|nr:FadR family transcriptional regulator [Lachnospiraceae bacterium]